MEDSEYNPRSKTGKAEGDPEYKKIKLGGSNTMVERGASIRAYAK